MSRIEDFDNGIWSHPDFEELSRQAAWLYIWSWTNPRCDMAGIYQVGKRAMTESRVELCDIDVALAELAAVDFAYYEDGVLWISSRVKRLRSKSPRMAIGVARDFAKVPVGHPLRARWLSMYGDHAWLRDALKDVSGNLNRTSVEVPVTPDDPGDSLNLTSTSIEVPKDRSESYPPKTKDLQPLGARASGKVDQTLPPRELPTEIAERLHPVLALLEGVQRERGGNVPTVRGVGLALTRHPRRDHLAVAYELQHWALAGRGQNQAVKDWARTYTTFLERSPEADPSAPSNVTTLRAGVRPTANTGDLSRFDRIQPANAKGAVA
jgi:hypothetical protein